MLSSLSLEELISWSVSGSDERGLMLSVNATCKKLAQLVAAVNARRHEDYVEVACYNGSRKYVLVESAAAIHFLEELVATNQDFQGSVRVKAGQCVSWVLLQIHSPSPLTSCRAGQGPELVRPCGPSQNVHRDAIIRRPYIYRNVHENRCF